MNNEIIVTGKTVDDAVAAAIKELGVKSAQEIEYTVVEEPKKGLFGIGAVPAKISAKKLFKGELFALNFIEQLVKDMGLDVTVEMKDAEGSDKDCKLIDIQGEGAGVLIGHHGDTLDSLQYLANLAANKKIDGVKPPYVKISVDAENYRARREETLRSLARRMAERVLKQKKSVMLEPMNPYERRIIHSTLQSDPYVTTHSEGEEPLRKVVVTLKKKDYSAEQ